MIADIHDMRRGFIPAKSRNRSHKIDRKSVVSAGKGSLNFIRRFGATVTETFGEWRRWVWPMVGSTLSAQPSVRKEIEEHVPQIERSQTEESIVLRLRLPGLRLEKVKVEVFEGVMMLSGEYREETENGKGRVETFFRSMTLPEGIMGKDVKTEFGDGVLEISMRLPGYENRVPIRAMVI